MHSYSADCARKLQLKSDEHFVFCARRSNCDLAVRDIKIPNSFMCIKVISGLKATTKGEQERVRNSPSQVPTYGAHKNMPGMSREITLSPAVMQAA